jgi:hypothetical protein
MTDQITDTPDEAADKVVPQTTPDSTPTSVEATSLANDKAAQAAGLTEKQIREYVRNEFKSLKDKRFAKLETAQEETSSRLDQYEQYRESGLTPAQAKRELAVDELLANRDAQPVQMEVNSGLTPSEAQSLASSLTGGLPQEAQQKILAEVDAKAFTDTSSLSQFVVRQAAAAKPAGSQATMATPSAGEAGDGQLSPGALLNEYTSKVIAARGNRSEIRALNADYKEQGLDVDSVVFTV